MKTLQLKGPFSWYVCCTENVLKMLINSSLSKLWHINSSATFWDPSGRCKVKVLLIIYVCPRIKINPSAHQHINSSPQNTWLVERRWDVAKNPTRKFQLPAAFCLLSSICCWPNTNTVQPSRAPNELKTLFKVKCCGVQDTLMTPQEQYRAIFVHFWHIGCGCCDQPLHDLQRDFLCNCLQGKSLKL